MAKLIIEGQTHTVPDELVKNGATVAEQDANLRDALRPNFDLAANATFRREEKDGETIVTVMKAPGTKGYADARYARLVERLQKAPHTLSASMELDCELRLLAAQGRLDLDALLALQPRLDQVLTDGQSVHRTMTQARQVLMHAPAVAGACVPPGF